MNNSILKASEISKNYNQGQDLLNIFESINYSFEQSKTYSIAGESGTGKSTLLNLLSGIDIPTSGKIYFNNKDINIFSHQEKDNYLNNEIGIVFQEPYLIRELTVLENIMIKGLIAKLDYQFCKNKAYNLLSKIGLEQKANSFPSFLSVGQQQRIAILRAIFNEPKFLIADEPTANLDQKTKSEITDLLFQYKNNQNVGLIIATHDSYIINLSEKRLILDQSALKEIQ